MTKRQFPAMPECTNCGDCCGPVTARPAEVVRIRAFVERRNIAWQEHGDDPVTCGFYQRGLCAIYSVRPAACRMYGVVAEMACAHFPNAAHVSFPAKSAIASGLMDVRDGLLAEAFAPDKGEAQMEATRAMIAEYGTQDAAEVAVRKATA